MFIIFKSLWALRARIRPRCQIQWNFHIIYLYRFCCQSSVQTLMCWYVCAVVTRLKNMPCWLWNIGRGIFGDLAANMVADKKLCWLKLVIWLKLHCNNMMVKIFWKFNKKYGFLYDMDSKNVHVIEGNILFKIVFGLFSIFL